MTKKYDSIGIKCNIFSAKNETEHFHRYIELDFVIRGNIRVVIEEKEYDLKAEEMILIDSNKRHYIYVDSDALVCRINISYDMLSEMLDDEYVMFLCSILTDKDTGYNEIKSIIRDIILVKMSGERKDSFRLMEYYGKLLDSFIRNYRISLSGDMKKPVYNDAERIRDVVNYINLNYQEPINLVNIADQMFVSVSTLSRSFKKATGMKFPDYINKVRMHYAVSDLLNTNKSITEIAVDNGFSSPSSFNRVFKELYNTTPSQYKKSVRNLSDASARTLTKQEEEHIRKYLNDNQAYRYNEAAEQIIELLPAGEQTFFNISTMSVNLGAFYRLTNSSVQSQIRQMSQQLNLKYLRMWNIFSPQCMIAERPDSKTLSFEQVDIVFDFLIQIGIHPFMDLSCHPEVLIKSGKEVFFKKEDRIEFKNIDQWSFFLDRLMEHVVFRYGRDEVSKWLFEITDYPMSSDDYAYYDQNRYQDVYKAAVEIIKKHSPKSKIGGPGWFLDGNELELVPYFNTWKRIGRYPDFYSVCLFPYNNSGHQRDIYNNEKERNMDPDFLKNQMKDFHCALESVNAPLKPVYVSEISTILSNRNALNDHCCRGTNVLHITNEFQNYADMICFWVATDRLSLHYAPSGVLHGGSGLMSKDGIPKPTYYALYFLSKLGKDLLGKGDGYIAVRNAPGNIYILCYNHKHLKYSYKYEESRSINVNNADTMFENYDSLKMKFMVYGLDPGEEYVIKRHIVNQEYGSVMDEWRRLGFEPEMRGNDIDYLKNVCVPRIQMKRRVAEQGRMILEAELSAHEMMLIHIYK